MPKLYVKIVLKIFNFKDISSIMIEFDSETTNSFVNHTSKGLFVITLFYDCDFFSKIEYFRWIR